MLEKLFFTGLGTVAVLKEKVESEIKTLEEKGKIKADDAKSFLESIEAKGKEEDEKLKAEIRKLFKEVIDDLGIATKEDISKLKEELK